MLDIADVRRGTVPLPAEGDVVVFDPIGGPIGVAIATGNAFILKPSERDPSVPVRLAELFREAGLPEGIELDAPKVSLGEVGGTYVGLVPRHQGSDEFALTNP